MKKYVFYALKTVVFLTFTSFVIILLSVSGCIIDKDTVTETALYTKERQTVIIDPGHGGEDGGAEANGVIEKDINLSVSLYISDFLDLSCYPVALTRIDDRMLYKSGEENHKKRYDLLNRVEFAESYDNALFVSVHQNKFEIPKYKGLQVYYSPNNADSLRLAECIQFNSKNYLDLKNKREVKQADFRIKVLDMLKMPAVLIECGFLSNPEEAALLASEDYQKKMAFVIYLSLAEYLENGDLK